jgi:FMN phosphatase YigB (HAD superfamily)
MPDPPKFIYFDLGKVLVDFSIERMCRQMGQVSGVEADRVFEVLFDEGLYRQLDLGQLAGEEFYQAFCEKTGSRPDYDALEAAGSDIFELNLGTLPLVAQLAQAGRRLGVLSNTCRSHWEHCTRRFRILAEGFELCVLSFEVGAAKPDPAIFRAAAEAAGVAPEEIFFMDDLAPNVAGALEAGFDAVQYTSSQQLAADLRARAVRFNY